jgi:hypothetical protein
MGEDTQPQIEDQAQMGVKHVLRPFPGFGPVYTGKTALGWIMLTEGNALDEFAGQPGYPTELLAGLRVPMGARLQIWLPHIYTVQADPSQVQTYNYTLIYRLRNLVEYRTSQTRGPWHSPNSVGVPDTTIGTQPRVLKPAGYRTVTVQGTAPSAPPSQTSRILMSCYPSDVTPFSGNPPVGFPLAPDGNPGIIQSGVLDPAVFGPHPAASPFFDIINDVALGDELLIAVWRPVIVDVSNNWNFATIDSNFFTAFASSPNVGVYVFEGKVPAGQNSYA